ncbi:MAG: hypothetical protein KatS3mg111_0729 [Pirellulaceae bacterium]|nr:MAG: hypothetical protein KatS3mg111_0729 [Pirellulaceae bacterium]
MRQYYRFLLAILCVLTLSLPTRAQSIVQIEEDWELVVIQPEVQLDAPQITMTMLPFYSSTYLQVDINHATEPEFQRGGVQVRACDNKGCFASKRLAPDQVIADSGEVIRWTQSVRAVPGGFEFGIESGSSSSFGAFGGSASYVTIPATLAGSGGLEAYNPMDSLNNSGVTFSRNRVERLRLKSVRVHLSSGDVFEWGFNADIE